MQINETDTQTLDFELTKFTLWNYGNTSGSWECSIEKVDRETLHIKMTTIATSGDWAGFSPEGEVSYWVYEPGGDELDVAFAFDGYPAWANFGPYYKE